MSISSSWARPMAVSIAAAIMVFGPVRSASALVVRLAAAERYRLANGLDVVLQEDHRDRRVAVVVAYDIGSRDEPAGYEQLAHLVEHMTYRGSRHLEGLKGFELLERAGAERFNGMTSLDQTVFHAVVPSYALPLVLYLESERMAFTLERFDEVSLDLERDIIKNELLMKGGHQKRFSAHVLNAVFGEGHAYSKSPASLIDIDAIRLRDVRWFFQQGYRPSNAHLIVVGDFDSRRAKELILRYFGPVLNPRAAFLRAPPPPDRPLRQRRLLYEAPVHEGRLKAVWQAPRPGTRSRVAAELLASMVQRFLQTRLIDDLGDASTLSFSILDTHATSLFTLDAVPSGDVTLSRLEASIDRGLAEIWDQDLDAMLSDQVVSAIIGELQGLADPLVRALKHVESLAFENTPYSAERSIDALRNVTTRDLATLRPLLAKYRCLVGGMVRARPGAASPWGSVTVSP